MIEERPVVPLIDQMVQRATDILINHVALLANIHGRDSASAVLSVIDRLTFGSDPLAVTSAADVASLWSIIDQATTDSVPMVPAIMAMTQKLYMTYHNSEIKPESVIASGMACIKPSIEWSESSSPYNEEFHKELPTEQYLLELLSNYRWLVLLALLSLRELPLPEEQPAPPPQPGQDE